MSQFPDDKEIQAEANRQAQIYYRAIVEAVRRVSDEQDPPHLTAVLAAVADFEASVIATMHPGHQSRALQQSTQLTRAKIPTAPVLGQSVVIHPKATKH